MMSNFTDVYKRQGYAPSGVRSITLPDGEVVEADTADFIAEQNGSYDFIVTDNAGNTYTCLLYTSTPARVRG